jgi:D-alanyl-D-alanine carboxypeptidase (penicillin-binding protein 5/6)
MENGGERQVVHEYHEHMAHTKNKAPRRRKKLFGRRVLAILLLLVFGAGLASWLLPLPALSATPSIIKSPTSTISLPWPSYGEAAIGAQGYGVLETSGTQPAVPTASVAKMITALTVLKQYPLSTGQPGPTITLGDADVASYNQYLAEDGSVVKVVSGEQITEYQAIEAMLLPSANNMADSLATWAFGSLPSYVTAANQMIASLGLSNTVVASDASGFLPGTVSTASDLVRLGEVVLGNPVLAQIVGEKQADVPIAGTISNVNGLLGTDGVIGIKTGNTDQAGGVYLFAGKYSVTPTDTVTVIGAIMGAPTLTRAINDSVPLLNAAYSDFQVDSIVTSGEVLGYYTPPWSDTKIEAAATKDISVPIWRGSVPIPNVALNSIYTPAKSGQTVGYVTISLNGTNYSSPVTLSRAISNPPVTWRLLRRYRQY